MIKNAYKEIESPMSAVLAQLVDGVIVHRFEITADVMTIGRHPGNQIVIDDAAASASHASMTREANADFPDYIEYFIEDCGSTNGTYLNDRPLVGKQRLRNNDIVRIAWNQFKFLDPRDVQQDKTAHIVS